jgi:hypothetical protein
VTDWFVGKANTSMTDPDILRIRSTLARADAVARLVNATGASFQEAGASAAVMAQWSHLAMTPFTPVVGGPMAPPFDPTITGQLRSAAGTAAPAVAAAAGHGFGLPMSMMPGSSATSTAMAATVAALIASAALDWRTLVNHGARYDFKRHVMFRPSFGGCPDPTCPPGEVGTVTMCAGPGGNCFDSDRPGNIFYGLLGGYAGFSENTLQLGSQLAELTDLPRAGRPRVTWDTPDDTAAISLGFALPLPLTPAAYCAAVAGSRSRLGAPVGCSECTARFPP